MKKLSIFFLIFSLTYCSSDQPISSSDNETSNQKILSNKCKDIQDALNQVYVSYSEVEAGSLPSPATLDSFLDWPLLFNENLKNNPAYNDIITSILNFEELITNNPECLSELE
tara:strand:- start:293 stop:631 length:339 start_codon:yes stop_codon:yes gene_type:complete